MRSETYNLVFCSIIAVMSFVTMYISVLVGDFSLTVFGIAVFILCTAVCECGIRWGLITGCVVGLLGLIFLPSKAMLVPYILFFWYYPSLKFGAEKTGIKVLEWVIKISAFSVSMLTAYLLVRMFVPSAELFESPLYVFAILTEITFILYDIALTKGIGLYKKYVSNKIKRK